MWYDFELGKGGDLFDLIKQEKHCDFKESVNYLQDKLGIHPNVSRHLRKKFTRAEKNKIK